MSCSLSEISLLKFMTYVTSAFKEELMLHRVFGLEKVTNMQCPNLSKVYIRP